MTVGGPGGDPYMGLMGPMAPQATSGLLQMPQTISPTMQQNAPQNWSQVAYQMAGSPNQNPFSGMTLSPTAATSPAGGGATALGGSALGILGALGKAAGTNSNLGNAISGLLGNGGNSFGTYTTGNIANVGNVAGSGITNAYAPATAQYTSGLLGSAADAAGTSGIAPVGTGAIDAAADAGASTAIPGLDASGLLGSDAAAGAADAGATAGTAAAADAGATAGAAGADAGAAGAGTSAGLGTVAGAAGAVAPFAAILGKMLLNPDDVMLKASYWSGLGNSIQGKTPVNTSWGAGGPDAAKYAVSDAVQEALSTPQDQVPAAIQQMVWQTGLVPYGTWGFTTPAATGGGGIRNTGARRNYGE